MKMQLNELLKRISPLPWKVDESTQLDPAIIQDNEEGIGVAECYFKRDAAYLAHAANVLPGLVEALEEAIDACSEVCGCGECGGCEMADRHFKLLLEAKTVEAPE